ncbi:MAG: ferredoxin--NADP reductase [Myxococcota bacterium]
MAKAEFELPVTLVEHYTESYFRFRLQRPASFRFTSGQFVMVGLEVDGAPVLRAYSISSAHWDEELEFYSIIVPDGKLTSRLKDIKEGDSVLMSAKPVGTLTVPSLHPGGRRLFMLSTGTGIAPFGSIIRDELPYERYEEIYLTQTCRFAADLQYGERIAKGALECPLVGEMAQAKFNLYSSVTREPYKHEGRITTLIESGKFFEHLDIPPFDPESDRVMICGSMDMLRDTRVVLDGCGFSSGAGHSEAGYVWEKAFTG